MRFENPSQSKETQPHNGIEKGMLTDPELQAQVANWAIEKGAEIGDEPTQVAEYLGEIELPNGEKRKVWMRHAADSITMDKAGNVLLIVRKPGVGMPGGDKLATTGGFIDKVTEGEVAGVEQAAAAAERETTEETGFQGHVVSVRPTGPRKYNRPFDIREAFADLPDTDIKKGDLFIVSTRAFRIDVATTLDQAALKPQTSEVREAVIMPLSELEDRLDKFGIKDHPDLIKEAMALPPPEVGG